MKHLQPFPRMSIDCSFHGMAANYRRASFRTVSFDALLSPWRSPVFQLNHIHHSGERLLET